MPRALRPVPRIGLFGDAWLLVSSPYLHVFCGGSVPGFCSLAKARMAGNLALPGNLEWQDSVGRIGGSVISVIVPAHNEEAVIARCLGALLEGAEPRELDVVVACNGCTDRTAERARAFGDAVTVIELEKPSKTAALNAADRVANAFPRLYVDADVILPLSSVRRLAAALENDEVQLASPVARTDVSASNSAVRAFYDIWLRLPYNRVMVGTGVYALSERGRKRFGKFPEIIADDGFVRSRFLPQERAAVEHAPVTVYAPRTFGDLVRVKTRGRVGGYELREKYPSAGTTDRKVVASILRSFPWGGALPWKLIVYGWVNFVARVGARRRLRGKRAVAWERDESSRRVSS